MATFYCDSNADCPENVGLIYSNASDSPYNTRLGVCTGFLVSENIVATNSHCIQEYLKSGAPTLCQGNMSIRFLRQSYGKEEIFGCKKIITFSHLKNEIGQDYAFFEISKTDILPVTIVQNGMKNKESVHVKKITPLESGMGGRLEVQHCALALDSMLNSKSATPWSETGVAVRCRAKQGNSGSPVFNSENQVIGILQSYYTEAFFRKLKDQGSVFNNIPDDMEHFQFTNLTCVPHPVSGAYAKDKCNSAKDLSIHSCHKYETASAEQSEKVLTDEWTKLLPSIFVYEITTEALTLLKSAVPICVKTTEQDPQSYLKYVESSRLFRSEKISLVYVQSLKFGLNVPVDQELRLEKDVRLKKQAQFENEIILKNSGKKWEGEIFSKSNDRYQSFDFSRKRTAMTLPNCQAQDISRGNVVKVKLANGQTVLEKDYVPEKQGSLPELCEQK